MYASEDPGLHLQGIEIHARDAESDMPPLPQANSSPSQPGPSTSVTTVPTVAPVPTWPVGFWPGGMQPQPNPDYRSESRASTDTTYSSALESIPVSQPDMPGTPYPIPSSFPPASSDGDADMPGTPYPIPSSLPPASSDGPMIRRRMSERRVRFATPTVPSFSGTSSHDDTDPHAFMSPRPYMPSPIIPNLYMPSPTIPNPYLPPPTIPMNPVSDSEADELPRIDDAYYLHPTTPRILQASPPDIPWVKSKLTLPPDDRSFRLPVKVDGWRAFIHPKGMPYYFDEERSIFTDSDMRDAVKRRVLLDFHEMLKERAMANDIPVFGVHRFMHLDIISPHKASCGYYFIDVEQRSLFWVQSFEVDELLWDIKGPVDRHHFR